MKYNIKKYNKTLVNMLLLLLLCVLVIFIYNYINKFPFSTYNFPDLSLSEYKSLIQGEYPVLFKNTLKYNIEWQDFCSELSSKEIKVRQGEYGTTNGRKERSFKNEKLGNVCKNINNSNSYGGNNVISLKEQEKVKLVPNNPNINMFQKGKLWLGPVGSRTPLHKDKPDNLAIQVYGDKKWTIFNKNDNKNLCFDENNSKLEWSNYSINNYFTCPSAIFTKKYEITLGPGDMLYLPSQWAHDVENITNSIMINLWY